MVFAFIMQLSISLSFLLAGVLMMLTAPADALPHERRSKSVTLPLKRVEMARGVHPQINLQQNINRSIRRLARMTGREEPSARELRENLQRRVLQIEGPEVLEKRYNRHGVPKKTASTSKTGSAKTGSTLAETNFRGQGQGNGNGRQAGKAGGRQQQGSGNQQQQGGAQQQQGSAQQQGAASAASATSAAVAPDPVAQAGTPTDNDSLGLDIEAQDVGYLATVQMGTPPRDFLLLMDSGSADLWVGAENCTSQAGGGCGNHVFLGPQSSSSFADTNSPFSVTYGTGSVSGDIITDNIAVAGLQLNQHTFGVATTESVDFSGDGTPFDGLMGLAQSTLSEQQTLTPIESLAKANLVSAAIVSYKISRLADNKNDGEITFGSLDTTKFDSATLVEIPNVNTQGFWEGALDSVSVNNQDLGLQGRTAILDTGTTLMVVPAADAATIHAKITGAKSDGQGGFTVPCTTTDSVALTFGKQEFAIDPRDIAFTPVDPNDPTGDCVSGISSGQIGGADEWLVGDVFLKNAYFSTNVDKNTVSLAKLV